MEQIIRRRVRVKPHGKIQLQAEELRGANEAEVIVIVEQNKTGRTSRKALFESIAGYAVAHAGTDVDLDPALEAASLELWTDEGEAAEL